MKNNDLTANLGNAIKDFLAKCESIKTLSLKRNDIGDNGIIKFAQSLEGKQSKL